MIYRWYELMGENILSFRNRTLSLSLSINSFYSFNIEEYRLIGHNLKILQIKLSSFILSLHRFIVSSKEQSPRILFLQERKGRTNFIYQRLRFILKFLAQVVGTR